MKKMIVLIACAVSFLFLTQISCYAAITIDLNQAFSFQDEELEDTVMPAQQEDDTALLKDLDGSMGPSVASPVIFDYYATGTNFLWQDGISANFDLSGVGYSKISDLKVLAYIQTGSYFRPEWHHYVFYEGAFNATNQDADPVTPVDGTTMLPGISSFDYAAYQNGGWISYNIPLSWVTSDDFDITFRLWNASVDQVKLEANVVPEPATMILFGVGLLGTGVLRKRR